MKREIIEGKLQGNAKGYAFLLPLDNRGYDYFIPHSNLKGAMHGDIVLAETTEETGVRTTARVLKVIERGYKEIVGTYFSFRGNGFVTPDDKKYFNDIYIPAGKSLRAKSGDKVVCKILAYPKNKNPEGLVIKILGRQFEKNAELKSILYSYKLNPEFDRAVKVEADYVAKPITKDDLNGRKDFRDLTCFTIDGEDSRDFDDAVSLSKKGENYLLGVHIADVSHYVRSGGAIDNEAFNRGTSVYFPESVVPMLPEKLCNDVCSLVEGEDRLTLSCIMEFDKDGKLLDKEIAPSVINSKKRFTYTEVQGVLDGDEELKIKHEKFVPTLLLMGELADILGKKRYKNGSVDLDVKESVISVSKQGEIVVKPSKKDKAHGLIEEFMIATNCAVAEYFYFLELPFIYRVHEKPQEEKLEQFYEFLTSLGISFKRKKGEVFSKDFQIILENAKNSKAFPVINRVMLRSMQKAVYLPEELGHFGLGEKYYSHFTSPIRRYPDLVIHRIIKDFLTKGQTFVIKKYSNFVNSASNQSSIKERNAIEAERAVDDFYKMLYISEFVGEEFDAVISGVNNFGVFAELENSIEGLIKVETLKGKKYIYDEKRYALSDGNKTFRLGQSVKIKVAGVNYGDRQVEFLLLD